MVRLLSGYGGVIGFVVGGVRIAHLSLLRRRYGFDRWHINPIQWRPYAIEACRYMRDLVAREGLNTVVEVGCGLGEILCRIPAARLAGYDLDEAALRLARRWHSEIAFHAGSFADVREGEIGLLIAVNFPHNIPPEELRRHFQTVLENNRVRYILVDAVRYRYYHDYDEILRGLARRVWESRKFASDRQLLCYQTPGGGEAADGEPAAPDHPASDAPVA